LTVHISGSPLRDLARVVMQAHTTKQYNKNITITILIFSLFDQ